MSSIRVGLAPLKHRYLRDPVSPVGIAAGEATVLVRSDNEAEPGHDFAVFVVFVVLAKHAHDVLASLEIHCFDI